MSKAACLAVQPSLIRITGERSRLAWATPFVALAVPGPWVVMATPNVPVASAVAAAMITAAVSVRAST